MASRTKRADFAAGAPAPGPIDVQVYIPQMQCVALSPESGPNNDRDETYILLSGKTPTSLEGGRLPRYVANDSYYEFWAGRVNNNDSDWTNHDQAPVGRPVLWTGALGEGESAEFLVTVMEQDNSDIGILKELLETGLNAADALYGSNTTAKAIITTARELAKYLPESKGHDFIGAFTIQVANVGGQLQTTFIPIHCDMMPDAPSSPGEQTALFDCLRKSGAHYRVIPAARLGPRLPVRTYIGKEIDRCGEALLAVEGGPGKYKGFYHVGKGKSAWVPVALPRFAWYCQTSKEWTTAPNGTNLVNVHRSGGTDREIAWYCYNEDVEQFRPDYKPTQTWVKLSTEIDQCSAPRLSVGGVGGFYHLAPGQQKWVPIPNREFHWYCDTSRERSVAPEETNLLRVTRNPENRQITWECCREIVSLQPYTTPDDTKVLIGRETDQCSAERLTVFGDGGLYFVDKGEEKWVPISHTTVRWLCGLSEETSAMPKGTNLLLVKRHATTREITWLCYHSSVPTTPYRQPSSDGIYLGTDTDHCATVKLTVDGADGQVAVIKGQQNVAIPLASNRFRWWCGDSAEFTTAPAITNLLKVSRDALGNRVTWKYYFHHVAALSPITNAAPAAASLGNRIYAVIKGDDNRIYINSAADGEAFGDWTEVQGHAETECAPAAAALDNRLYVFAIGINDKCIYVNSAEDGQPFDGFGFGWSALPNTTTDVTPAAAALGNRLYVFAKGIGDKQIYVNSALSRQAFDGSAWAAIPGMTTDVAPAAASLGNRVYVFVKGLDNRIYVNSALEGQPFDGWGNGWSVIQDGTTDAAPAAASLGNRIYVFAKGIEDQHIYVNSAADGAAFGSWKEVEGGSVTDAAPAAAALGNRIYVFGKGIDDQRTYVNSALEGQPFDGWGNGWTQVQ